MVYVLDSRMGEIVGASDALAARPRTWREALERIAFAYRRFLVAHPDLLPLLVGRLPIGPHALTIRERSLAALTERGFSQELAARAFTTLLQYVVGSAVTQAGSPAPDEAAAIRDYYRSLDPAAYPHVAAAPRRSRRHRARRGRRGPGDRARWHRSHPPAQRALALSRRSELRQCPDLRSELSPTVRSHRNLRPPRPQPERSRLSSALQRSSELSCSSWAQSRSICTPCWPSATRRNGWPKLIAREPSSAQESRRDAAAERRGCVPHPSGRTPPCWPRSARESAIAISDLATGDPVLARAAPAQLPPSRSRRPRPRSRAPPERSATAM